VAVKTPKEGNLREMVEITLSCDALGAEELMLLPSLKNESMRNQAVLAMSACGYPQKDIADAFDITQQSVWELIHRIDPNGVFRLGKDAKKAFVSKLAEGKAMVALSSITKQNMDESSAVEKMRIAKIGFEISQGLNQSKHSNLSGSSLAGLMEQIEKERVEIPVADVEEL